MTDRRNDSAMTLDVVALDDEDRRTCPSQTRVIPALREPSLEPAAPRRCPHAQREIYRIPFPIEP